MTPFRPPSFLLHPTTRRLTLTIALAFPAGFLTRAAMSTAPPLSTQPFPAHSYTPRHSTFPYTSRDFIRSDESSDTDFYSSPRFVTHIDDHAIGLLRTYYAATLPRKGKILDLCSSWISHFPPELEQAAAAAKNESPSANEEGLKVVGLGMNAAELKANPILHQSVLQDLNVDPIIPSSLVPLAATVCVVSIDYLTKPLEVLTSIRERTNTDGSIHLIISNRCFPTKAVGRWLRVSEQERLQMVGDYLHHSGWQDVEIVELSDGRGSGPGLMGMLRGGVDPLWVVRGVKTSPSELGKSEL